MIILVTGATGTVGRNVVEQLIQHGPADLRVRALTRNPETAGLPEGVEAVRGDLASPDTLADALDGVTAVHFINFTGHDYAPLTTGEQIVELAERAGVRRVTVLGGRADGSLEQALAASAIETTMVHPVEFMSNTLQWWAAPVSAGEPIREPFPERISAMVHPGDIGAVAAKILLDGGHGGKEYFITGPEALDVKNKARILGDAVGREIEFVELTAEQAREKWLGDGMHTDLVEFLIDAWGNTPTVGRTVLPTVEQITGRPPRTFAQWAAENAASFR